MFPKRKKVKIFVSSWKSTQGRLLELLISYGVQFDNSQDDYKMTDDKFSMQAQVQTWHII